MDGSRYSKCYAKYACANINLLNSTVPYDYGGGYLSLSFSDHIVSANLLGCLGEGACFGTNMIELGTRSNGAGYLICVTKSCANIARIDNLQTVWASGAFALQNSMIYR